VKEFLAGFVGGMCLVILSIFALVYKAEQGACVQEKVDKMNQLPSHRIDQPVRKQS
jgi:hypothetical protein